MINITRVITSTVSTNTYIVYNNSAIVIDAGGDYEKIKSKLKQLSLKCEYVLITHGHFDHIGAVLDLQKGGAKIVMPKLDYPPYRDGLFNFSNLVKNKFIPDILVEGGQTLELCNISFKVIATPGHTPGGVCYVCENNIFSGDTLFLEDIGRTDLYGGNEELLIASIKNELFSLEGDYNIFPGHGECTTLNNERRNNPYV